MTLQTDVVSSFCYYRKATSPPENGCTPQYYGHAASEYADTFRYISPQIVYSQTLRVRHRFIT